MFDVKEECCIVPYLGEKSSCGVDAMAEAEKKKSFWEIFAIVVGAIAALITAIAALLAAMNGGAAKEKDTPPAVQAAPSKPPPADDAEAERLKAEAAAARAKAAELERKLAEAEQKKAAAAVALSKPKQGDTITDDVTGMKLAYVPGGCFMMGSPPDEEGRYDNEGPAHKVCVDGFWMGQYEVTQGLWEKVMGANPSNFKKGGNYPVESVSWDDAQQFIVKLNSSTGKSYRLPTEAEWEYACRANSPGKCCGGDDVDAIAWHDKNSGGGTHPVGGKDANVFSLHDMSGNVWEWCSDWYDSGYYAFSPQSNPVGPESGSARVFRGGGWFNAPRGVRAARRYGSTPDFRSDYLGFRLVLPVR
jgi:formylglycine-generating enzyme required for sulfatase activity